MKTISAPALADWLHDQERPAPRLLDVREPWEQQICHIAGSRLLPIRSLPAQLGLLDADDPIVCICHHGIRSAHVAMWLARQGFADVYNLSGGVDAWARQVDLKMATY
ncbi:MAG: sulfurtransferase [Burkholderiales bacterium]|nr:MAG: sulfurtransferase [Burkholderiales bacterium]